MKPAIFNASQEDLVVAFKWTNRHKLLR